MPVDTADIFAIVEKQNQWRGRQCINLIASENTPSQAVRSIQLNDFMGRYAEGHPNVGAKINRYYQGTQYIDQIETMAAKEVKELFNCAQAEVRALQRQQCQHGHCPGLSARRRRADRQFHRFRRPYQPQFFRCHGPAHPDPRPGAESRQGKLGAPALLPADRGPLPYRRGQDHRPDRTSQAADAGHGQEPLPFPRPGQGDRPDLQAARNPDIVRRRPRFGPDRRRPVPRPAGRRRHLADRQHAQDLPRAPARHHPGQPRRRERRRNTGAPPTAAFSRAHRATITSTACRPCWWPSAK